uniref:Centriole, cilia and spindle-associated protein n=1 Tax=Neogobius melanostomus TaxID=47308 RepID=A0A8C6TK80_9GOBI
ESPSSKTRTEYMKKFKDPKWDSFCKCYEDCVKYRLSRRMMEGSHRPWLWGGWESSSESSGWSTPRGRVNRVDPLSPAAPPDTAEVTQRLMELRTSPGSKQASPAPPAVDDGSEPEGGGELRRRGAKGQSQEPAPDQHPGAGPAGLDGDSIFSSSASSRLKPLPFLNPSPVSLPQNQTSDACVQTGRPKTGLRSLMRRARSADLEKMRKSQLSVADGPWVTEYMRCFSARVR